MTVLCELLRFLIGCYFVRSGAAKMGAPNPFWAAIMAYGLTGVQAARVLASIIPGVLRRPRTSLKCVASTRGCSPFSAVVRIFSGYDHRLGQKNPSRGLRLWRVSNEGQRWPCRAQHDSRPRAVAYPHIISSTGRQQEPRTIMPCRRPHRHSIILAVQKTH